MLWPELTVAETIRFYARLRGKRAIFSLLQPAEWCWIGVAIDALEAAVTNSLNDVELTPAKVSTMQWFLVRPHALWRRTSVCAN